MNCIEKGSRSFAYDEAPRHSSSIVPPAKMRDMRRSLRTLVIATLASGYVNSLTPAQKSAPSKPPQSAPNVKSLKEELSSAKAQSESLKAQVSEFVEKVKTLSPAVRNLQEKNRRLEATIKRFEREPPRYVIPAKNEGAKHLSRTRRMAPRKSGPSPTTPQELYNKSYRAVRDGRSEEVIPSFAASCDCFPKASWRPTPSIRWGRLTTICENTSPRWMSSTISPATTLKTEKRRARIINAGCAIFVESVPTKLRSNLRNSSKNSPVIHYPQKRGRNFKTSSISKNNIAL